MSQKWCCIENCLNSPSLICNCKLDRVFICQKHATYHSKSEGKHFYSILYSEISESTRKATAELFYKIKSDLKQYKIKIIQEESHLINQIYKVTKKMIKNINDCHKKVNEILLTINSLKNIDNTKSSTFIESLLLKSTEYVRELRAIRAPRLNIHNIDPSLIKNSFELEPFVPNFYLGDHTQIASSQLKYIKSSEVNIFDAKNFEAAKYSLQISDFLNKDGTQCLLPDGSLFYYNDIYSSIIVDPHNKVKRIPYYNKNRGACSIYANGSIYVFGGDRLSSEKYDLKWNKWIALPRFPNYVSAAATCAVFKNYILLGGIGSKIIW